MTDQAPDKPAVVVKPAKQPDDPYGQALLLRAQAAALEASIPADAPYVRMKTEAPHESFQFGGTYIGSDWTTIPEHLAPGVLRAAADAGVTVTQQEGQ
jgi:hypothetical protein